MNQAFNDLMLEFDIIFEAAVGAETMSSRRILWAEANMTLIKARHLWQGEMKTLRGKAENLRDARLMDAELNAGIQNSRPALRRAPPPHIRIKAPLKFTPLHDYPNLARQNNSRKK